MKIYSENNLVISGNFYKRIAAQRGLINILGRIARNSKDKTINTGQSLIFMVEEKWWTILNWNTRGDENGEFTYIRHKGNTFIDYVLVNDKVKKMGVFK